MRFTQPHEVVTSSQIHCDQFMNLLRNHDRMKDTDDEVKAESFTQGILDALEEFIGLELRHISADSVLPSDF